MPDPKPNVIQALCQGLIVSCQAPVDSPLHEPTVIAAIAQAALNQGAVGVRIDTPAHISAVRQRSLAPLIGLWKQQLAGYEVYITPQFHHAAEIARAGADIIAIDATLRNRPGGETVATLIKRIHEELGKQVLADVDTIDAAIAAEASGADLVATTLYGYTARTNHLCAPGFDLLTQLGSSRPRFRSLRRCRRHCNYWYRPPIEALRAGSASSIIWRFRITISVPTTGLRASSVPRESVISRWLKSSSLDRSSIWAANLSC